MFFFFIFWHFHTFFLYIIFFLNKYRPQQCTQKHCDAYMDLPSQDSTLQHWNSQSNALKHWANLAAVLSVQLYSLNNWVINLLSNSDNMYFNVNEGQTVGHIHADLQCDILQGLTWWKQAMVVLPRLTVQAELRSRSRVVVLLRGVVVELPPATVQWIKHNWNIQSNIHTYLFI